jgi:predicted ATP-binding protein involved in virulence
VANIPLSQASDGYKTIIALACDIIAGLGMGYSSIRSAYGLVLLDEIGAHLHPRWKMQVIKAFRNEFPNIQFIVSTHEPLCLRGLVENEVALIEKKNDDIKLTNIERNPSQYRVDQLLTSEFFGLHSTIDPVLDQHFQEYYSLLALPENERQEHQERIRELKKQLSKVGVLGYTRRDQVVYEIIDQYIAESKCADDVVDGKGLKKKTIEKVKEVWSMVDMKRNGGRR